MSQYVQYGCGHSAPEQWINFDSSPTLRLQKLPLVGKLLRPFLNTIFPAAVRHGDIFRGLPVSENSCSGVYCSHVLEHLSLADFRRALINTYKILKPGGIFRCVVPDLEAEARLYLEALKTNPAASLHFMGPGTLLGLESRPQGARAKLSDLFGNSRHLWMWDRHSLGAELAQAGFQNIRAAVFHDSAETMFELVEAEDRFENAAAMECSK